MMRFGSIFLTVALTCLLLAALGCKKDGNPTANAATDGSKILITLKTDGSWLVDGQATTTDKLEDALGEAVRRRTPTSSPTATSTRYTRPYPYTVAFALDDAEHQTWEAFYPAIIACVRVQAEAATIADMPIDLPRPVGCGPRGYYEPETGPADRTGCLVQREKLDELRKAMEGPRPMGVLLRCERRVTMAMVIDALRLINQSGGRAVFYGFDLPVAQGIKWQVTWRFYQGHPEFIEGVVGGDPDSSGWDKFGVRATSRSTGHGPKCIFFGNGGNAHHVVFCIDAGGSMALTPEGAQESVFDKVKSRMISTISHFKEAQDFDIVFFRGRDFTELPDGHLVPATRENAVAAVRFMEKILAIKGPGTEPNRALNRCFDILDKADAKKKGKIIFLLTDGGFGDNQAVVDWVRQRNKNKDVRVFTYLTFEGDEGGTKAMKDIAAENGGKYTFVKD